tara:strand:+ start:40301 stop:40609 length:309 start_codon:yes stop_codon:yes gene_type:complete
MNTFEKIKIGFRYQWRLSMLKGNTKGQLEGLIQFIIMAASGVVALIAVCVWPLFFLVISPIYQYLILPFEIGISYKNKKHTKNFEEIKKILNDDESKNKQSA